MVRQDFTLEAFLGDLRRLVERESKTGELEALTECARVLAEIGDRILDGLAKAELVETAEGPVVQWRVGEPPYRVGLIGHYDTVHPLGSVQTTPYEVDGDTLRGLGTFDMKAGLLTMLYGAAEAARAGEVGGLLLHCCPDEEDGSLSSQALLRRAAEDGLRVALVYEGAGPDATVYTERKGGVWLEVTFTGRSAHASRPEEGANALRAMAELVTSLPDLERPDLGTTVVATTARSGDTINSVPGQALLTVDCRTRTVAEQDRVHQAVAAFRSSIPEVSSGLVIRHQIRPMEAGLAIPVYEALVAACRAAHIEPPGATMGRGVSDANHLSGLGVHVIDGMGPEGGLDHSPHEWIRIGSIADRVRLTAVALPAMAALAAGLPPGRPE